MQSYSSTFTPKTNNLTSRSAKEKHDGSSARGKRETSLKWDTPFRTLNDNTTHGKETIMDGVEQQEADLWERKDSDRAFSDRLSRAAEEESTFVVETCCTQTERRNEELLRRLKVANDRVRAKSDALDLIYSQWQKTQKELEEKAKAEATLQTRLAIAAKQHQETNTTIGNLKFKLFLAESDLEERKEKENDLNRKGTLKRLEQPIISSGISLGSNEAYILTSRRMEESTQTLSNIRGSANARTTVLTKGSEESFAKGFFAGFRKTRVGNGENDDKGKEQPAFRRVTKRRSLLVRAFATRDAGDNTKASVSK